MFKAFDPGDAIATMLACHYILPYFVLAAAMRHDAAIDLDPSPFWKVAVCTEPPR